ITTPDATLRRVPPAAFFQNGKIAIRKGDQWNAEDLQGRLQAAGYRLEPRVEGPCELSVQGGVIDVFPAGALGPARIELAGGRVSGLSAFDPATQRVIASMEELAAD